MATANALAPSAAVSLTFAAPFTNARADSRSPSRAANVLCVITVSSVSSVSPSATPKKSPAACAAQASILRVQGWKCHVTQPLPGVSHLQPAGGAHGNEPFAWTREHASWRCHPWDPCSRRLVMEHGPRYFKPSRCLTDGQSRLSAMKAARSRQRRNGFVARSRPIVELGRAP